MNLLKWLVSPYGITKKEIVYLSNRKLQAECKNEKIRINQLLYFNVLFLALYSLFFISSLVYILIGIFISYEGFLAIIFTFPMLLVLRKMQESRYLKRREAYIKNDPSLME